MTLILHWKGECQKGSAVVLRQSEVDEVLKAFDTEMVPHFMKDTFLALGYYVEPPFRQSLVHFWRVDRDSGSVVTGKDYNGMKTRSVANQMIAAENWHKNNVTVEVSSLTSDHHSAPTEAHFHQLTAEQLRRVGELEPACPTLTRRQANAVQDMRDRIVELGRLRASNAALEKTLLRHGAKLHPSEADGV